MSIWQYLTTTLQLNPEQQKYRSAIALLNNYHYQEILVMFLHRGQLSATCNSNKVAMAERRKQQNSYLEIDHIHINITITSVICIQLSPCSCNCNCSRYTCKWISKYQADDHRIKNSGAPIRWSILWSQIVPAPTLQLRLRIDTDTVQPTTATQNLLSVEQSETSTNSNSFWTEQVQNGENYEAYCIRDEIHKK